MWVLSLDWEDPLEDGMAAHSGILAWKIPWREKPGGLQSIGSHGGGHDCRDLACRHTDTRTYICNCNTLYTHFLVVFNVL